MPMTWRRFLTDFFSPLTLAALAAWLAVWFSMGGLWEKNVIAARWAHGAALLFLILFLAEHAFSARLRSRGFALVCAALAALALVPIALTPFSAAPILLVLWASMLAARYEGRRLWLWLVAVNLLAGAAMWVMWPSRSFLWVSWLGYFSFQVFAALVMRYAAQSEAMSQQLREVNAELLATRSLLTESARESERLRLSRELHDVAGHKLTALKLNLAALARQSQGSERGSLDLCTQLADELLSDIRRVVQTLRADEGIDLQEALQALAEPMPRPRLHLQIEEGVRVAALDQAEAVLRSVQEALTNSARHSDAANLWVVLRHEGPCLQLDIRDDGRVGVSLPMPMGNGLRGMRERMQALGGELDILRTDTGGVRLNAWWTA